MDNWLLIATATGSIFYVLITGLFLTFSDFVMRSLAGAEPAGGVQVMQNINRDIFKSVTMVLLWGMVAVSAGMGVFAYFNLADSAGSLIKLGAASYVIGVLIISYLFNIPMNNRLEKMDFRGKAAQTYWPVYVPRWVFWNWFRALGSLIAGVCFLLASLQLV